MRKGNTEKQNKKITRKKLLKIFRELDANHDNCISPKETKNMKNEIESINSNGRKGRFIGGGIPIGISLELLGMATIALRGLYQQSKRKTGIITNLLEHLQV